MNEQEGLKYIRVPEGVNIFNLLALDQPANATNISNWKVGISPKHLLFPNISGVLEVSGLIISLNKYIEIFPNPNLFYLCSVNLLHSYSNF